MTGSLHTQGSQIRPRLLTHQGAAEFLRKLATRLRGGAQDTAEGFFSNLKRQINGTHHSVSKKHLARVTTEHDFKYNNRHLSDSEIAEEAIGNIEGRRLTLYKTVSGTGESLYDVKQGEKPKTKTARGSSLHKRTGKKAPPPSADRDDGEGGAA